MSAFDLIGLVFLMPASLGLLASAWIFGGAL